MRDRKGEVVSGFILAIVVCMAMMIFGGMHMRHGGGGHSANDQPRDQLIASEVSGAPAATPGSIQDQAFASTASQMDSGSSPE